MANDDYLYFVSYARDDLFLGPNKDRLEESLSRFLQDLREAVRISAGRPQDDRIDFRDAEQIGLGRQWRQVIIDGLQASRLVLAIYTPLFFGREECGVELGFMRERRLRHFSEGSQPHDFVVPVIWHPVQDQNLPAGLKGLNYNIADLPPEYKSYGLRRLAQQQRFSDQYKQSVEAIAAQIDQVRQLAPLPPHPDPPSPTTLNIFAPASVPGGPPAPSEAVKGPSGVRFAYVAATRDEVVGKAHLAPYGDRGEEWQPSPADDRQIGMLAPIVAGSSRFIPYPLTVNDTLPQEIADAEEDNALVVLLVDVWSACRVAKYETLLRRCDKVNSANCATLVVWNEQDPDLASQRAQLENLLQYQVFRATRSRTAPYYRPAIESVTGLEGDLRDTLERLRNEVMTSARVHRAPASTAFAGRPGISATTPAPPEPQPGNVQPGP